MTEDLEYLERTVEEFFQMVGVEVYKVSVDQVYEYVDRPEYGEPDLQLKEELCISAFFNDCFNGYIGRTNIEYSIFYDRPGRWETYMGNFMTSPWTLGSQPPVKLSDLIDTVLSQQKKFKNSLQ